MKTLAQKIQAQAPKTKIIVKERGASVVASQTLKIKDQGDLIELTIEAESRASYFTNKKVDRFRVLEHGDNSDFKAYSAKQFAEAVNLSSEEIEILQQSLTKHLPTREVLVTQRQEMNSKQGLCPTPDELGFKQIGGYVKNDQLVHTYVSGDKMIHFAPEQNAWETTDLEVQDFVQVNPTYSINNSLELRKQVSNLHSVKRVSNYMAKVRRRNLRSLGI